MPSITTELAGILSKVHRHGDFFAFGKTEILAPRLEVAGVGLVALPLLPAQAEQLIAVADQAPHGRGADTLVDVNVRRTWQIHADQVQIGGKHWSRTLDAILARVAEGLGVSEPIAAEFYKLLIYDEGSFFVSHRDTEKTGGMFATLVVVMPSVSTGGELIVRHKAREVNLDMRCEEPCEAAFAAFYADCVHEVLPVTSGFRLTLVYNLLRKGKGRRPEPPRYDSERDRAAALLKKWAAGERQVGGKTPEKLIYPLDHAYTPAELGFETLKGADAAKANLLAAAAPQAECDLHLALLS
jgi:predicted 2-oxoglutarate/Fe(II)-dependent dioxygenase YbiX